MWTTYDALFSSRLSGRISDSSESNLIFELVYFLNSKMGGLGCDNMTVVLVCFLNGEPYEYLAERCKLSPLPLNQMNISSNISPNDISYNSNIQSLTSLTSGIHLRSNNEDNNNWNLFRR